MIIYKITNRINGKVYIGQTIGSIVRRWREHCSKGSCCPFISRAIQKYGKENFTIEQIDVASDRQELDKKEVYWIAYYDSLVPNGYNLTSGGETNKNISEDVKRKISEAHRGEKNPMFGKRISEEHRRKISEANKGIEWSKERRLKITGSKHPKARKVLCVETGEIFECINSASASKNLNYRNISNVCIGRRKTCGGFHWRYVDE